MDEWREWPPSICEEIESESDTLEPRTLPLEWIPISEWSILVSPFAAADIVLSSHVSQRQTKYIRRKKLTWKIPRSVVFALRLKRFEKTREQFLWIT